jgi:hypothetical protein
MAQTVNMEIPNQLRLAAAIVGANAKDFAHGWAAGVMAWKSREVGEFGPYGFRLTVSHDYPVGSVKLAAFDAAITFMRGIRK